MSETKCQRCGKEGQDRRILRMACFYAMNELGLPFAKQQHGDMDFYTLRVCKKCRGDWLTAIKTWFETPEEECQHSNAILSDEDEPLTYYCPDCGENFICK